MEKSRALVWFKRDLRTHDHAALVAALAHTDSAALFIVKSAWLQSATRRMPASAGTAPTPPQGDLFA